MLNEILEGKRWGFPGRFFPKRKIPLHSMLVYCGFETRNSPSYDFSGLKRGPAEFAIWQYTVEGIGTLEYEGKKYKMRAGNAMLLHIPHNHRYYFEPESGTFCWRHIHMTMTGTEIMRLMRTLETVCGPVVTLSNDSHSVCSAVNCVSNLRRMIEKQQEITPFTLSKMAYDFVMSLCNDLAADSEQPGTSEPQFIKAATAYCMEHLAEEISVDDMAEAAGYSRFHFSRMFHDIYGVPPARFLRDLRLKTAMRMLQMEHKNVKEISGLCGFSDESYFCRLFKRAFGKTPRNFRDVSDTLQKIDTPSEHPYSES